MSKRPDVYVKVQLSKRPGVKRPGVKRPGVKRPGVKRPDVSLSKVGS